VFPPFPLDLGYGWKCGVRFACVTLFGRVAWNFLENVKERGWLCEALFGRIGTFSMCFLVLCFRLFLLGLIGFCESNKY
jgi:hypothetical protein